ncbi:MAG: hypothetical protein ACOYB8_04705 [Eubacteriaceae bacterium]|jgi:hypothetical protein
MTEKHVNSGFNPDKLRIITAMPDGLQEWTWAYDRDNGDIYRLIYIGCACTDKENTAVRLSPEALKHEMEEYGVDHPYMLRDYERYLKNCQNRE